MAYKTILPGFGGAEDVALSVDEGDSATKSDVYDLSRLAQFAVQFKSISRENGSVQMEQSFDNVNWNNLGTAFTVVGSAQKFDITDGPFGLIRFSGTVAGDSESSSSSNSSYEAPDPETIIFTLRLVGWELQRQS